MHLQEPAFRVFEDWCNHLPEDQISWNCAHEFQLSEAKARCFVKQIICRLQKLLDNYKEKNAAVSCEMIPLPDAIDFRIRYYVINGIVFQFRFADEYLEEFFHPGLASLLINSNHRKADHIFNMFYSGDQLILQTDDRNCWKCPELKSEYFIGLVYLQLVNCLNHCTDSFWMGTVHASVVVSGKGAILITAPSGNGKSTFAAMLMKNGYQVLSDDFTPISLYEPKVYPFPEGISVKNRSLKLMQSYYPELVPYGEALPEDVHKVFLPFTNGDLPKPKPVKAIVFLQYDPEVKVKLNPVSNLDVMDRLLRELWLPQSSAVVSQFMDWYFSIPCYILSYNDVPKATASLMKQFEK